MLVLQSDENIELDSAATLLNIMANSKRLHVLTILRDGEVAAGKLAKLVGLSPSALSQHLAKLRFATIVETRRDLQTVYYSCKSHAVIRILDLLDDLFVGEVDK
ncbi:winged helix-turn-helix transcriptional regulator (plasmid) [Rhizobium sp. B230/85]|uniref:ArsR/SmtB family transcription factor n=1 Tax=unclassified Rhizobium TaxID=2613769 RepID=UPI001AD976FA|nr:MULTISPECIES: metalloregulator ArsR/SmtB family transcription factor [unclassified Rhizobium]MBO9136724.1 winged helix-turn-helix transcriptional regulator [Rhizobium sp. B209b/85]QXZ99597.1 winged helix-turn-helix transcriptional regulator [Rhizobium sp. B230/85]